MSETERPYKIVKVELLTREREGDHGVRRLTDEEYEALSADELRSMIRDAENDPFPVMEEDGTLALVNALYHDHWSDNAESHEEEVKMYEDGTFELIKKKSPFYLSGDDDDEDEEDAEESTT
jgi:hypothetical protein